MTTTQHFDNHLLPLWADNRLDTPAFVYDEAGIDEKLELLAEIRNKTGCRVLYSIKALSFTGVLNRIAKQVDGFSVSSLFESRLAREILGGNGTVHLCSPGIRSSELAEINRYCDFISFNSLSQWQRFRSQIKENVSCGLRINPELSYVNDVRFDPCRAGSKLGVPVSSLDKSLINSIHTRSLAGIHVHNNCESDNYQQLAETVLRITGSCGELLASMQWINLGGGYLLNSMAHMEVLCDLINDLSATCSLKVFIEPGKAVVGEAGYLVATVIDMFESGDKNIAVLDTTINHLPEVFEYQYKPAVLQDSVNGKFQYRLAGASCLSGDLFGDYCFEKPLETGSRIIFANVGSYMMVKANLFNGINLPSVYVLTNSGKLSPEKVFDYRHFRDRL